MASGRQGHDHEVCIGAALERAGDLCARRGARLTTLRRRVLELIWQDHTAVKAYDLLGRLGTQPGSAKPPTVYRALDFLLAHGLVHRLESMNAYVGCPTPEQRHDGQFLICRRCGEVREFQGGGIAEAIAGIAADHEFAVEQRMVEARGACATCRADASPGDSA
jgi:Fur family zinc uptake transcriptional regulator